MTRWVRRYWALPAVMAFMLVVAGVSMFGRLGVHRLPPPDAPPNTAGIPTDVSTPPEISAGSGRAAAVVLTITGILCALAAMAVLAVAIYRFVRWLRRHRFSFARLSFTRVTASGPTDDDLAQQRDAVLAAVDAGIADLTADDADPRGAVIACWVRLEAVAAAAGLAQRRDATSSDLVAHLLASQRVSVDALTSLADLYRAARFSRHVIEATMRDEARAALARLRGEIVVKEPVTP